MRPLWGFIVRRLDPLPAVRKFLLRLRREVGFLLVGFPLHLGPAVVWVWCAQVILGAWDPVFGLAIAALLVVAGLSRIQRWRYRAFLGVHIPKPSQTSGSLAARLRRWLRSPDTWRRLGYHVIVGPFLAVAELAVFACFLAGVVAVTIYAWIWFVPPQDRTSDIGYVTEAVYITIAGAVVLLVSFGLARLVVKGETRAAVALLGPSMAEQLRRRVRDLAESRAAVVDAADAERRRIERDLHDGAQQRLVSLAVNLGLAKATLTDLPEPARQVIEQAHQEAKEALAELNDLVRGLNPVVLGDRGLDAALSGLVARVPFDVRLRVELDERPSPTVESVAYFLVSEALTNAVKHAKATRVDVTVVRTGQLLRIAVEDNGVGGVDVSRGTGLVGLTQRVGSIDGTLDITSPEGGPTRLTAELPCEQ